MQRRGFISFLGGFLCSLPFLWKREPEFHTMGQHFGKTVLPVHKDDINKCWISPDGIRWEQLDGVKEMKPGYYRVHVSMDYIKQHPTFFHKHKISDSPHKITHRFKGGDCLRLTWRIEGTGIVNK